MKSHSAWSVQGDTLVHASGNAIARCPEKLLHFLPDDAMPSRPRGDAKERTFNLLIRDGVPDPDAVEEGKLIGDRNHPDPAFAHAQFVSEEHRELFGRILDDHYVVEVQTTRFLFPFQTYLPGTYEFWGRYKMFNGKILAFLCQPGPDADFNRPLIDEFYRLFNDAGDLSLLDASVLELARATAADGVEREARSGALLERAYGPRAAPPGALIPDAHRRFQQDLETVLGMRRLNRRDRITAVVNVFYLHLALYFQRLAWLLEEELDCTLDASSDPTLSLDRLEACFGAARDSSPFRGTVRFRVGGGQSLPVSLTDGCVASYREQNRRLLLLPANLSVLGAARAVMRACGKEAESWTFAQMLRECRQAPELGAQFNEGLVLMAQGVVADRSEADRRDVNRQIEANTPGLAVLREALLKSNRSALRRHGRDIVHGLVLRGGRGYLSSRGKSLYFFEMGQDLLLLLAKTIVRDSQLGFRQFLDELKDYGFEPQSRQEEEALAETLRSLNLLEKHSDAGEAMYVKHFL